MSFFSDLQKAPIDMRTLAYAEAFVEEYQASGITLPGTAVKLWPRLKSTGGQVSLVLDPLKYARPDISTYTRIDIDSNTKYRVNGGAQVSYGTTLTLPSNSTDYVIYMSPTVALGKQTGITVSGGRNIAFIGGEIDFSNILTAPFGFDNYNQSDRRGLQIQNFLGDVYVEGVWIHGNQICDGIWFNPSVAANRKFVLQNCLIEGMASENLQAQDDGIHPDIVQWIDKSTSVYAGLKTYFYQVLGRTAYQGFTTNDNFPLFEMERVHIDMRTLRNWDDSKQVGYAFGFFAPADGTIHLRFGPDVEIRKETGQYVAPVYPEQMPGWWDAVNYSETLTDPAWFSSFPTPGKTYAANMPMPVVVGPGDLPAHIAATTTVHGIPNTAALPVIIKHGSNANTAREAWAGTVIWIGTVQPVNAVDGDMIWLR